MPQCQIMISFSYTRNMNHLDFEFWLATSIMIFYSLSCSFWLYSLWLYVIVLWSRISILTLLISINLFFAMKAFFNYNPLLYANRSNTWKIIHSFLLYVSYRDKFLQFRRHHSSASLHRTHIFYLCSPLLDSLWNRLICGICLYCPLISVNQSSLVSFQIFLIQIPLIF